MDEHVARAATEGLRRRGVDVLTAQDAGMLGADDEQHLAFAPRECRTIFTQDADFLRLHAASHPHSGIVYAPQQTAIGTVVRALMLIHESVEPDRPERSCRVPLSETKPRDRWTAWLLGGRERGLSATQQRQMVRELNGITRRSKQLAISRSLPRLELGARCFIRWVDAHDGRASGDLLLHECLELVLLACSARDFGGN